MWIPMQISRFLLISAILLLRPWGASALGDSIADDPATHFTGRVTGSDGKAIPHARIYAAPNREGVLEPGAVRAEADGDGRFDFKAPDLGYIDIDGVVSRPGCIVIATAEG